MFNGQNMKSFEQLAQEFDFPGHDLYTFLQLRLCFQRHKEWERNEPTKLDELFMSFTEEQ